MKIKGKMYRTVVGPVLMYGTETWALTMAQENKLEIAEMRMLRWLCGVTNMGWVSRRVVSAYDIVNASYLPTTTKMYDLEIR